MSTLATSQDHPQRKTSKPPTPSMMREVRPLVAHLYRHNAKRYWLDFLTSITIGYACSIYYMLNPWGTWQTAVAFVCAGLALYRVSMFIHEIVHFRPDEMRAFSFVWNLVAGIPMLMPSFFYESHQAHHNTHDYGTHHDGEYLPLVYGGWRGIIEFLAEIVLLPVFFVTRFMIGTPISLIFPGTRDWILRRCSSFVVNLKYEHQIREDAPRKLWALIELCCFARIMVLVTLIYVGAAPFARVPKIFALAMFTVAVNHFRTMSAHRYLNEGESISHSDQFLDSTNISGGWLTELICPLGSRYHAVHHLFPRMPYHNLGKAHRILTANLPADSPYHQVNVPNVRTAIWDLFRNVHAARKDEQAVAESRALWRKTV